MSEGQREGKTAAELQIENLKRLKAMQSGLLRPKPEPARPAPATAKPRAQTAPPAPAEPGLGRGLMATGLLVLEPAAEARASRPAGAKPGKGGTRVLVDTLRYRRLKAKWKAERRFKTEKQYWDWALDLLLAASPANQTLVQQQRENLLRLKQG
jgi:hypothetical protein